MDILAKILNNSELAEKIRLKCDIELYPQLQKPDDMDGKITWNIDGKAFGVDASGGEFILLSEFGKKYFIRFSSFTILPFLKTTKFSLFSERQ